MINCLVVEPPGDGSKAKHQTGGTKWLLYDRCLTLGHTKCEPESLRPVDSSQLAVHRVLYVILVNAVQIELANLCWVETTLLVLLDSILLDGLDVWDGRKWTPLPDMKWFLQLMDQILQ